ncbi:HAD family hydrolase [Litoribrevibacter albus]|uniref:Phosphoglycolate phosphatase n=1 Tax=Litoribrevibacter albus TaxID=1473156 RepID=A0AA37S9N2_9GAMM|nr:HAD-IA family hydrolase [Litoribrevibacter albus]GLQ30768.1 phosphoglycolate phosphatase [Litoribrevibacter albus]
MTYKAILFDLDGTLLDSAVHFHTILNRLAKKHDLKAPSETSVRSWASNGAAVMVEQCLEISANTEQHQSLCDEFLKLYDTEVHESCPLFDGVEALLRKLADKNIPLGIITNKGRRFYQHIEPQISEIAPIAIGITRDDVTEIKPNPEGLEICSKKLSVPPSDCLYIGDHKRDIDAAHNAQMPSAVANWGYLQPGDQPSQWNATHIFESPNDLMQFI